MKIEIKKIIYEGVPRMEWENGIEQKKVYPSIPQNELKNSAKILISYRTQEKEKLKGGGEYIGKALFEIIENKISNIYWDLNEEEKEEIRAFQAANRSNTGIMR